MTLTREEFRRTLLAAAGGEVRTLVDGYGGGEGGRTWRITLADLPPLDLGALHLDRLQVDLHFKGYGPPEQDAFMARFLAHFRRGGG